MGVIKQSNRPQFYNKAIGINRFRTNASKPWEALANAADSLAVNAFETAQEASILETESRMQNQSKLRDARSESEIANLKLSGKNALSASYLNALSTGIEATTTIQSVYGDYKKPKKPNKTT